MMKTEVLLNFLGFIADVDPGPVLVVEPRTEDAKALSKDRVAPMFRSTPACAGRSRRSSRAIRTTRRCTRCSPTARGTSRSPARSRRPGLRCGRSAMRCSMRWTGTRRAPARRAIRFRWRSNAPRSSSTTRRSSWLHADDQGRQPHRTGVDRKRPARLLRAVPEVRPLPGAGVRRRNRAGLVWPEGKPEEAMYRCAGCRELIPHHQKAWMVERGEYRAQNPLADSGIPHLAVGLAEAGLGIDRHRVHRGEEVAGDAQGVHEHGARGTVDGTRVGAGLGKSICGARITNRDRAGKGSRWWRESTCRTTGSRWRSWHRAGIRSPGRLITG